MEAQAQETQETGEITEENFEEISPQMPKELVSGKLSKTVVFKLQKRLVSA